MPQPQSFLVQVLLSFDMNGSLTYTISEFYNSARTKPTMKVNLGDQVGWLVQLVLPDTERKPVPYSLDFSKNPVFFGTSSLSVPAGGLSRSMPVVRAKDSLKYSIIIPGLMTIDPDIQSGPDTGFPFGGLVAGTAYTVFWDTANPTNPMTYSVGGGAPRPLPVQVTGGDSVTFNATGAVGAVANFTVTFAGLHWASPFDPNNGRFSAVAGTPTVIGPLLVNDTVDPGGSFTFIATITVNGKPITSAPTPNAIDM